MTPEDKEWLIFGPGGQKGADAALDRAIKEIEVMKAARRRGAGGEEIMATEQTKEMYHHKKYGAIEIPEGYEHVAKGRAQEGDRIWGQRNRQFSPNSRVSNPIIGDPVTSYICLIRKILEVKIEKIELKQLVKKLSTTEFQDKMKLFI